MSYTRLLGQTCTAQFVSDTGARDGMGDPTEVVTTATYRCLLQQSSRDENTVNRESETATWNLYLEAAAAGLDGGDRVIIDGITYELFGPPWPTYNPRVMAVTHVEALVKAAV